MSIGLVRTGWSTCALLCLSWTLVAWQSNGSRSEDRSANDRRKQQASESRLPWLTMDEAMKRLRKSAPKPKAVARQTAGDDRDATADNSVTTIEFLTRATDDGCGDTGGRTSGGDEVTRTL